MATIAGEMRVASNKVGLLRFALTGALSAGAFAILCWLGARLGIGPITHMYLQLFTNGEIVSFLALIVAVCWSFLAGLVVGGLIALFYNLLAPIDGP